MIEKKDKLSLDSGTPPIALQGPGKTDFSKLKVVDEGSIEAKLYQIIDDIDTAGDMFKPPDSSYVKYIYNQIAKKNSLITSDGYKLFYINKPPTITRGEDDE